MWVCETTWVLTQCSKVTRALKFGVGGVECTMAEKGCVPACVEDAKRLGCTRWYTGTKVTRESAPWKPLCVLDLVLL